MILASRISVGRTGDTNSASSVPRSHSRAMTIAVRKAPTSVMISTIRPGTRYQVLVFAELNHILFDQRDRACLRLCPRAPSRSAGPLRPLADGTVRIAADDHGAAGLGAMHQQLHLGVACREAAGKIIRYAHDAIHPARQHQALGIMHRAYHHRGDVCGELQPGDDVGSHGRWVFQYHRDRRVRDIERQPVAENQDQHDRQDDADGKVAFVAQQLANFLAGQGQHALPESLRSAPTPTCFESQPRSMARSAGCLLRSRCSCCLSRALDNTDECLPPCSARRLLPPACTRTSCGVPSASSLPASWITMRSQYSASSMKWVVMMIVVPLRQAR